MNIQSVVIVLLSCVCLSARALVSYGSVQSEDNWVFIEKFCFDETGFFLADIYPYSFVDVHAGGEVLVRVTDNTNSSETLLGI